MVTDLNKFLRPELRESHSDFWHQEMLYGASMEEYCSSLVAQMVKNLPAMQETQVQFLDQEEPLEKGMATHSTILAWRTP